MGRSRAPGSNPCGATTARSPRTAASTPQHRRHCNARRHADRTHLARYLAAGAWLLARPRWRRRRRSHRRSRTCGSSSQPSIAWALHALYWSRDGERVRIASRAADARAPARRSRPAIDPAALYAYVYFHHVPSPLCIYRGVAKLPRAHSLRVRGADTTVHRYRLESFHEQIGWRTRFARRHARRDAAGRGWPLDVGGDGRGRVPERRSRQLDRRRADGASAWAPDTGRSFSIGFDADGYDEMEYARIAARHFGLEAHEHYLTPDEVLAVTPTLLRATDEPFGNSSIAAAYQCALIARAAGVSCLLAGDGGDELFAGNSRYAKQLLFERYQRVAPALRRGVLETGARAARPIPAHHGARQGLALRRAGQRAAARPPAELQLPAPACAVRGLRADLSRVRGLRAATPLWREEYAAPSEGDAVNRMLFLDWALHAARQRPRQGQHGLPGGRNVRSRYPMLDHALVDLACSIPGSAQDARRRAARLLQARDARPPAARDHRQDQARLRSALRRVDAHASGAAPPVRNRARFACRARNLPQRVPS